MFSIELTRLRQVSLYLATGDWLYREDALTLRISLWWSGFTLYIKRFFPCKIYGIGFTLNRQYLELNFGEQRIEDSSGCWSFRYPWGGIHKVKSQFLTSVGHQTHGAEDYLPAEVQSWFDSGLRFRDLFLYYNLTRLTDGKHYKLAVRCRIDTLTRGRGIWSWLSASITVHGLKRNTWEAMYMTYYVLDPTGEEACQFRYFGGVTHDMPHWKVLRADVKRMGYFLTV